MKFLFSPRNLFFSLFIVLIASGLAFGQAATGTITGTVVDESDAVIPGADVTLTNEGTGNTRQTVSNDEGFFAITAVPAGTYTLTIQMPGFATWKRTNIVLRVADRINVPDITLSIAGAAEEITVTSAPETIAPTDSGEKAAIITSKEIQNLAIVGRSAVELMKILPGVVYTGEGFPGETVQFNGGLGSYNVAGTRNTQVALLSDGADVIDPGCDCGAAVTPNVDMVSEVKVQTASFGADQAKGPIVFQSVTKSGTSEFHGEGYVYFRNDAFNSQDWRANRFGTPKPDENYYFPGFNIGGPLTSDREKLFFFAGFEFMGQNFTDGDIPAVVPTQAMRQGDYSAICTGGMTLKGYNGCPVNNYWGNWTDPGFEGISEDGIIDPSLFDPGGQALVNLYPLPNRDPAANDGWNYVSNIVKSQHRDQEIARIDWSISDNTKLYTRFNHEAQRTNYPYTLWWTNDQEVPYPSNLDGNYNTWSSSTSLANVLSPTTTNEVVVALTWWLMPHELTDPDKVSKSSLGYPYDGLFENNVDMVPSLTGWSSGLATLHQAGGLINPTIFGNKTLVSVEDNFSKVLDTHTLKIGGRYSLTTNHEPTTNYDIGIFTTSSWGDNAVGNAYADLLMGRMSDFQQSTINVTGHLKRHEWAAYVQDSWKATRRLTLELGARFLHNGYNYDTEGRLAGFDPGHYDPNAPLDAYSGLVAEYLGHDVARSVWETPTLLFSPRFGFAYDLSGSGKTVLRGGAGIYQYHGRGADSLGAVNNPPLAQNVYLCCGFDIGWPDTQEPTLQKSSITVLEPYNDAYPSTISFSLTVSQRLPGDIFWETSYVGNTSSHQLTSNNSGNLRQVNLIPEGTMPVGSDNEADYRPYHSFNDIFMKRHMLSQNYHSLQIMMNRQTGAFNFATSYTFSKAMGVGGDSFGVEVNAFDIRNRSYGPLGYDRTHSFSISYNYLVPDATDDRVLGALLNGWQLTGITQFQSGAPIRQLGMAGQTRATVDTDGDGVLDSVSANDAIDIAGSPDTTSQPVLVCDPRQGAAGDQWFNPNCFEAPTVGNNGHFAWPYFKGPGFQNHDLSVFKNWQLGSSEDRKLQFRLSFYNLPNHPIPFFSGQERRLDFTDGVLLPETIERDNIGSTALKRGRRIMQFAFKYMF